MIFQLQNALRRGCALLLMALALSLTACGGGGGGNAGGGGGTVPPPPTNPEPQLPPREHYALQTTVPAAVYSAVQGQPVVQPTIRQANVDRLNAIRAAMGIGQLRQNAALDQAAQGHALYLATNWGSLGSASLHAQDPAKPGFTGADAPARLRAAGYAGSAGETIAGISGTDPGNVHEGYYTQCVEGLLNAPYHTMQLVSRVREIGIGVARLAGGDSYTCVVLTGLPSSATGQLPDVASAPVVYPHNGQTDVATRFEGETPDPIPDLSKPRGHFVSVSLKAYETLFIAASDITVERFVLKDANGNLVPVRLIADAAVRSGSGVTLTPDPNNWGMHAMMFLLPLSPLMHGHRYTVEFSARAGSRTLARTWSFTTTANTAL